MNSSLFPVSYNPEVGLSFAPKIVWLSRFLNGAVPYFTEVCPVKPALWCQMVRPVLCCHIMKLAVPWCQFVRSDMQ